MWVKLATRSYDSLVYVPLRHCLYFIAVGHEIRWETPREQYIQLILSFFMNVPVFNVAPSAIGAGGLRRIALAHLLSSIVLAVGLRALV